MTWEVAGTFVAQVMIAPEEVMLEAATALMVGGVAEAEVVKVKSVLVA